MATFTATLDNLFGSTVQVRASLKMGEQLWGFFLVFSFPKNFSPAIDIHNLACASVCVCVCVCVCVHVYNTCSIDNEATNAQYSYIDNFHQLILHYTVHVRLLLHRIPSPPPPPYTHTHKPLYISPVSLLLPLLRSLALRMMTLSFFVSGL